MTRHLLILLSIFTVANFWAENASHAQPFGVRQMLIDYHMPTHYSPDDPWTRSAFFRQHVGYYGRFFNCDNEEAKRYSPYIYWQAQDPRRCHTSPVQFIAREWRKVQTRIRSATP